MRVVVHAGSTCREDSTRRCLPAPDQEDDRVTLEELDEERSADLVNYEGLEESEEAAAEIAKRATAGRRRVCDSLDKVKEFLGADPVVSKLGRLSRPRQASPKDDSSWTLKSRKRASPLPAR